MGRLATLLKNLKLTSVDFVRRGANPEADIALYKSADMPQEVETEIDVKKAEDVLPIFIDMIDESLSSIMKADNITNEDKLCIIEKSMSEFIGTVDNYLSSLSIVEKSDGELPEDKPQIIENVTKNTDTTSKGDLENMAKYENVDKSLLSADEAATLEALIAKAQGEEKEEPTPGKVNPAKAKKEIEKEEGELHPEVKKALERVEALEKSLEMQQYTTLAKKYEEATGEKAEDIAKTLYDLKKSGDANYNAYVAILDKQVAMTKDIFSEIGKSGNYNYTSVAKSEPEQQIEIIAKSYRDKNQDMSIEESIAKAWENNPDLFNAYEQGM